MSAKEKKINMNISKTEYKVNKLMTKDLLDAEYFINNLGVETRNTNNDDEFRTMSDIIHDVVIVCNNNPTIIDDVTKFLAGNPTTSDESDEFLKNYNLEGIGRKELKI